MPISFLTTISMPLRAGKISVGIFLLSTKEVGIILNNENDFDHNLDIYG